MTTRHHTQTVHDHERRRIMPPTDADTRLVSVTAGRTITASPERVWAILADDFDAVGEWASTGDRSSGGSGAPADDGSEADRYCEVPGLGETRERISVLDQVGGVIGYVVEAHGMPGFLRSVESTWRITALDSGASEVRLTIDARVGRLAGRLLGPALRAQFRRTQRRVLADLDVYARTGQVSRRKARMLASR